MSWNYRILAHRDNNDWYFQVHRVYYEDGNPDMYSADGTKVGAESIQGIDWVLDKMKECIQKPVLSVDDFPEEWSWSTDAASFRLRSTPDHITRLLDKQIFVFGSNLAGIHGKGAAETALKWGAVLGQPEGLQGRTYGIPTKNRSISQTLSTEEIKPYVNRFIHFAEQHPEMVFLVTEIGCGLARLKPRQVAPLFSKALGISNIWLPKSFWKELSDSNQK